MVEKIPVTRYTWTALAPYYRCKFEYFTVCTEILDRHAGEVLPDNIFLCFAKRKPKWPTLPMTQAECAKVSFFMRKMFSAGYRYLWVEYEEENINEH